MDILKNYIQNQAIVWRNWKKYTNRIFTHCLSIQILVNIPTLFVKTGIITKKIKILDYEHLLLFSRLIKYIINTWDRLNAASFFPINSKRISNLYINCIDNIGLNHCKSLYTTNPQKPFTDIRRISNKCYKLRNISIVPVRMQHGSV